MTTEAILAVWPNGIPPHDYTRLLKLIRALNGAKGHAPAEPQQQPVKEAQRPSYTRASKGQVAAVMELLKTGPATAVDLSKASGIPEISVRAALRDGGAVIVGHMKRANGFGRGSSLWGLPK